MAADPHRLIKAILALSIGSSSLALQVFLPALPAIQRDFGVSAAAVQLSVSIPLFSVAVGTLFWGVLSDRYGRRPAMIGGFVMFLGGTLLCMLADSNGPLIAGRIVQSVGSAAGFVVSRAVIRDLYGREAAAAALASLVAIMVIAPMFGPLVGGLLTDAYGWRATFAAMAAFLAVTIAAMAFGLIETNRNPNPIPGVLSLMAGYRRLLASADFRAYALQSAFMIAVFNVFLAAAPYVVVTVMQRPATEYGLWFIVETFAYVAGNLFANRCSERFGIDRMIRISLNVGIVSNVIVLGAVIGGFWFPAAIFIPFLGMGFANGAALPNANAGAVSVYPELAGTASGLLSFIQLGLSAVFTQAAGSIQDGTPYPLAIFMLAGVVLASMSFHLLRRAAPA